MHSPMKNQRAISVPTNVFNHASFTVKFLHLNVAVDFSSCPNPFSACGISAGVGGTNSTLAYFTNVASFGLEDSTRPFAITGILATVRDKFI